MRRKIIYIPGLGDRYDGLRRLGLNLWKRKNTEVVLVSMKWLDKNETYEGKLARIKAEIDKDSEASVTLVGESAGGGMALAAFMEFDERLERVVTVCGMNQGVGSVSPYLYKRNPGFKDTMHAADDSVTGLSKAQKAKLYIIYSSKDYTVRPSNTLIPGVRSNDIGTFGHMQAILSVLFWRYKLVLDA